MLLVWRGKDKEGSGGHLMEKREKSWIKKKVFHKRNWGITIPAQDRAEEKTVHEKCASKRSRRLSKPNEDEIKGGVQRI